jgi:hypothetical protein
MTVMSDPDRFAPQPTTPATRDFDPRKDRKVSGKVGKRLNIAHEVIQDVKQINEHAGNITHSLRASKGNSAYRGSILRDRVHDERHWKFSNEAAKRLALAYPEALHAARAEIMSGVTAMGVASPGGGGTCWDQAMIAFYFLRIKAIGEPISVVSSPIDHAFCHIGDGDKEPGSEVAVCDAWPTKATAVPWDEHFCYAPPGQEGSVTKGLNMIADGGGKTTDGKTDAKEAIKASLSLTPYAIQFIETVLTDQEVERHIASGQEIDPATGQKRKWAERVRPDQPVYSHWGNTTTTRSGAPIRSTNPESAGPRYMTDEQIENARGEEPEADVAATG